MNVDQEDADVRAIDPRDSHVFCSLVVLSGRVVGALRRRGLAPDLLVMIPTWKAPPCQSSLALLRVPPASRGDRSSPLPRSGGGGPQGRRGPPRLQQSRMQTPLRACRCPKSPPCEGPPCSSQAPRVPPASRGDRRTLPYCVTNRGLRLRGREQRGNPIPRSRRHVFSSPTKWGRSRRRRRRGTLEAFAWR